MVVCDWEWEQGVTANGQRFLLGGGINVLKLDCSEGYITP